MTRNVVDPETAETNRTVGFRGRYTFNALLPPTYNGRALLLESVRIGDHAHIFVSSGRPIPNTEGERMHAGFAGKLILAWEDWLLLREVVYADERVRICEVEKPTRGQADRYAGDRP